MKVWLKDKLRCWCYSIGWCPTCRQLVRHDRYEPFADCGCGSMEWTGKPPLLERLRWWLDRFVFRG